MISSIGLKEAKDIADEMDRIFRAATGFGLFGESYDMYDGPDRNLYIHQPRFMDGKVGFIKALRAFSKEGAAFHTLREAKQEYAAAQRRTNDAYQEYLAAVDKAQMAGERLAALERAEIE